MKVRILEEHGYENALRGMGFSFNTTDPVKLYKVSRRLYNKDGGHNKFLEAIVVWLEISAPRYWWQEFDTYRVGTTKQSESTIHTLAKKKLTKEDFASNVFPDTIMLLNKLINMYNNNKEYRTFQALKSNLPEGYIQKRMVCTNYKVLRNMINQRKGHSLEEWAVFIMSIKEQIKYKDLLGD